MSKRLAVEGAHVVFTHTGNNPAAAISILESIQAEGVKSTALVADSKKTSELTNALGTTKDKFGAVDILINNAGTYTEKPIEEYTLEEYDHMMDVNVKAVFVASQFAALHMHGGGRIITIGSNMADRVPGPGGSLYSMSKSALIGLTKGLARDLGSRGITANLIQPGPIDTDMNPADSDTASFLKGFTTLGRYGKADEVAGLAAYLASPESQFITGTTITIDGGFNI